MDSDQGKLFIGGISWETTEEKLKDHFEIYGNVLQTVVMRDKTNGRPRGFGFVVFADPAILDRVLQDTHTIEGKTVEAKRALSREEQHTTPSRANFGSSGSYRTKKIFVGGLLPTLTEEGFRHYFESYGSVSDVVIMYDQQTQRPRGFGFISFENEDTVDKVLQKNFHDLNGKMVEVKRALPKDANPGGGRAGGYQGYGFSGTVNSGSYDGRICLNTYMQSQNAFPPYGSSGYGYGASNNYSGYGSYIGSPAAAGGGGPRGLWNSQAPSGYGYVGYGNAGGGLVSANMGQSPGGYYGGYGGNNGSYGNQAAYGINVGGSIPSSDSSALVEMHGNFGGYIGGGYGGGYGGTPVPHLQLDRFNNSE